MFVGFALSGLQEFLYDLSPETQSRQARTESGGRGRDAARRLRIRSVLLTLVPGLVAREILAVDKGSKIVYLGGGKLIAQTSEDGCKSIEKTLGELYHWLALRSAGKLGACWAVSEEKESQSASLQGLLEALAEAKWRAGPTAGQWAATEGTIKDLPPGGTLGDRDWESEQGATFARREDWQGVKVAQDGWEIGPWRAKPVTESPDIAFAGKASAPIEVSVPTYTPKRNGETVPLHELAELDADGRKRGGAYLALLKIDGDGIGAMMARTLQRDPSGQAYRKASQELARFFGPDLADTLRNKHPRLYLVYSGGDDLVATGHFMDVLRAARDIQESFSKIDFCASLSGGIAFYSRQSSILRAIQAAEAELENAKENDAAGPNHRRDAVSVAGCRLAWPELRRTLDEVDGVTESIENEALNRGFLNLLRGLGGPWLPDRPEREQELRYRSIPQMAYTRSRRAGWSEDQWPEPVKALFDSLAGKEDDWPRASLVGTLAAWCTKKPAEDE